MYPPGKTNIRSACERARTVHAAVQAPVFVLERAPAFTLIELLVVVGVMALLMALVVPAMKGIKGGQDLGAAGEGIAGILDEARTYAMANNTHVFVGFEEVNEQNGSSVKPQVSGTGRVALAVVASKDGSNVYGSNPIGWYNITTSGSAAYSGSLTAISALQEYDNVHMASEPLGTGGDSNDMKLGTSIRPLVSGSLQIGNPGANGFNSCTQFYWPLGSTSQTYQYDFQAVIEFDPQGGVLYQPSPSSSVGAVGDNTRVQYLEVGLQPANGTSVSTGTDAIAIQIDGITGVNHLYRP